MVCFRIVALLLAAVLAAPVRAEPPPAAPSPPPSPSPSPQEAAQLEQRICAAVCRRRFEACATSGLAAEIKAPTCETDVVVCTVNCPSCIGAFAKCSHEKGASPQACQAPFAACMRGGPADGSAGRPLIRFLGGDGTSRETAVVVTGARNEAEGAVAELVWAGKNHPTWRKDSQALIRAGGKAYDKIGYTAPDGAHESWFDITAFFGKM